jgi:nitrogen-specific signal transduction histidine kinase
MRVRFEQQASALEAAGAHEAAASLRELVQEWWTEQQAWNGRLAEVLGVHHEINNALVGIRGNAQLLLMNPAVQQQGIRERLEVVLRESGRIQEATGSLRELKSGSGGTTPQTRAA